MVRYVIGASLSKPHTSVTALRMCVCMQESLSRLISLSRGPCRLQNLWTTLVHVHVHVAIATEVIQLPHYEF